MQFVAINRRIQDTTSQRLTWQLVQTTIDSISDTEKSTSATYIRSVGYEFRLKATAMIKIHIFFACPWQLSYPFSAQNYISWANLF